MTWSHEDCDGFNQTMYRTMTDDYMRRLAEIMDSWSEYLVTQLHIDVSGQRARFRDEILAEAPADSPYRDDGCWAAAEVLWGNAEQNLQWALTASEDSTRASMLSLAYQELEKTAQKFFDCGPV